MREQSAHRIFVLSCRNASTIHTAIVKLRALSFDTAALLAAYSGCRINRVPESFATPPFADYSGTRPSRVTANGRLTRGAHIEEYACD